MAYISLEKLAKNSDSYYKLVLAASERANEILMGATPAIKTNAKKHTTIAMEEMCEGKTTYKVIKHVDKDTDKK